MGVTPPLVVELQSFEVYIICEILKYGCSLVAHISWTDDALAMQLTSKWYTPHALSDDIQFNGDTPFEFGALALWNWLCLQNIRVANWSHPHLLNKDDDGDGTCAKLYLYVCTFQWYRYPHLWLDPIHLTEYGALKLTTFLDLVISAHPLQLFTGTVSVVEVVEHHYWITQWKKLISSTFK